MEDIVNLWRWEYERRQLGRPLLYSDLYGFLPIVSPEVRHDWDSTNWDRLAPGRDTYKGSLEAYKQACEDSPIYLQYYWQGEQMKKCVLQAVHQSWEGKKG